MAEKKKGFDLASALGDVSKLNTDGEQIVKIDVDRIDPDPNNFYSLDGIDALAGNIELIGLQQPLRVRPNGERFTVVSGHRRRAAILMIRDGGSDMFKAGVPCIVEYGEASEAMRKLRLIFANAATRVMTPSEISRQAEEVEMLLYQLKEQGVEFPGRMREHVAEACKISSSKLARLHAIRNNLDSNLLLYFDRGDLNEDAAYKLTQLPAEIQFAVGQELINGRRKKCPSGVVVEAVLRNLKGLQEAEMKCRAHAGGPDCHHRKERIVRSIFAQYDWNICTPGRCCMDCRHAAEGCAGACREAKDKVKLDAAIQKEKQAERENQRQLDFKMRRNIVVRRCLQLLPIIDAAKLKDDERLFNNHVAAKVSDVREWARTGAPEETFWSTECVEPSCVKDLKDMARKLRCDPSLLLGGPIMADEVEKVRARTEFETMETKDGAPYDEDEDDVFVNFSWKIGDPPLNMPGWYAVKVRLCGLDLVARKVLWWGDGWFLNDRPDAHLLDDRNEVVGWFPLPDDEEDEIEEEGEDE